MRQKSYRYVIERVETTIVYVEANTEDEADVLAWQKWDAERENYGIGENMIVEKEELKGKNK